MFHPLPYKSGQTLSLGSKYCKCLVVKITDIPNTDKSYPDDDPEVIFGTLFGREHPWFWKIHITALINLGKIKKRVFNFELFSD